MGHNKQHGSVFMVAIVLGIGLVHTAPTTDSPCCSQKKVGEVSYTLKHKEDTSGYGCKDDCIYQIDGQPNSNVCFKKGDLPVECLGIWNNTNMTGNVVSEIVNDSGYPIPNYEACREYCEDPFPKPVKPAKFFVYPGYDACTCLSDIVNYFYAV
eukprot:TRINITY_DN9856_c0_g1_i1.p1 TRINITY_DN9856_c0_g1~~TRINITY_DN9856_c0_g1_i1.p1  ORF type:complete len:169 (-),score=48.02 TRINITY_DN9856_c0_g1_i1:2-463(-)